ncbi:MAG: deoxyguanosinetriphosphate triphosphohydrolase [Clostridiaceae bacterium]|nr:deoxyguanosinetriphosphate triphosphohydrolase [Clostridiaceae bacterium]
MIIREQTERIEEKSLSPYATLSSKSKGRARFEEKCSVRTDFQRDRDRIMYSKAFRRLKHKTQVFISPEGDHYRTRLTHTLEVSQIARTIARSLRLNEDLTEAIALGHDLGHTPFGHAGERVLKEICSLGFNHNEQSVRVVDKLERNGNGLNLTYEVLDGILCHTGEKKADTLEGRIVRFADRIAYINHDIEDAIRGGVISEKDLPENCLKVLGNTSSERINNMIVNIIENSMDKDDVIMSKEYRKATDELRNFMFENVYIGSDAKAEEGKAEDLIRRLYAKLVEEPKLLPEEFFAKIPEEGVERAVCDYIAGMTDRYAVNVFNSIFIPARWMRL